MSNFLVMLTVLAVCLSMAAAAVSKACVRFDIGSRTHSVDSASMDNCDVVSSYQEIAAWNDLKIKSRMPLHMGDFLSIMSSAGFAEGYLSCTELKTSYANFYFDNFGTDGPTKELIQFIVENYQWMVKQSLANSDEYWTTVRGILEQINGVVAGYEASTCESANAASASKQRVSLEASVVALGTVEEAFARSRNFDKISLIHVLLTNAWGDIYTIQTMQSMTNATYIEGIKRRIFYPGVEIERDLRCSSLFKLLPDHSDVLFGHTTWGSYIALGPRTFKHFTLPSVKPATLLAAKKGVSLGFELREVHFSSAPGLMASLDDFNVIHSPSARLAVLETTNDILNPKLFPLVNSETNLCWMRASLANSMAIDGDSWSKLFGTLHSGTYTNQWQVLDMNAFADFQQNGNEKGVFTILEEIPGKVEYRDMSAKFIADGYWGSYNVPYFPDISLQSGNSEACRVRSRVLNDFDYCWQNCSRAIIFREKQASISTIDEFKRLINYNHWQEDAASQGDPCKSISCRRDLEPNQWNRYPSGGLDGKVSSIKSVNRYVETAGKVPLIQARVGPTSDDQPVFCWSQLKKPYSHFGQSDCFDFDWVSLPAEV